MALSTDDHETAGLAYFFCFGSDLSFVFFKELRVLFAGLDDVFVVGLRIAHRLDDDVVREGLSELTAGEELGVTTEHDVGTTTGHVGRDGDGAELTGLGDDLRFTLVVLRVQDLVLDALFLEELRELFGLFDGDRTDEDRLALCVSFGDLIDDGIVLAVLGLVDDVVVVDTDHRLVGRDFDRVQVVDLGELVCFGHGGTGHTGQLLVQTEVVLEGDGGKGLALALDVDVFLRLDGLVETFVVATAVHDTTGELIDDEDFAVTDDVVDVLVHDAVGTDGLVDVVEQLGVLGIGQVLDVEERLRFLDTALGEGRGLVLFVDDVVAFDGIFVFLLGLDFFDFTHGQGADELVGQLIEVGGLGALAGNDERSTGFIDEDGVDFVDDGVGMAALDLFGLVLDHVVTQVVETELVVRTVGDVGCVSFASLVVVEAVDDEADGQAEIAVDFTHPLGVTACEVVVDGDDVDAFAGEGVEVGGKGGDKGLTFTGLHLRDTAVVQDDTTKDLDRVGFQADGADGCLTAGRERVGEDVLQGLAVCKTLLQSRGDGAQFLFGHGGVFLFESKDFFLDRIHLFEFLRGIVKKVRKKCHMNI